MSSEKIEKSLFDTVILKIKQNLKLILSILVLLILILASIFFSFLESDFFKVYIDYPRHELIERINLRTEEMVENGAIKEVKNFIKLKVRKDKSVNKAIGVIEIKDYLNKEKDLNEIKEKIAIKTRQYAKRQSTWARGNMTSWIKLKPQDINKFLKKI